ncbi:uncharacterized protein LOC133917997 [Phragmites australis]|uniref:uncharacterized protein LOC133917997 n=1 Tax=Phragmites australis TaxID=29695 RepID=UPI002D77CAF2|nr:uncharacterized protein LOC133917997 [Phragmites australis]
MASGSANSPLKGSSLNESSDGAGSGAQSDENQLNDLKYPLWRHVRKLEPNGPSVRNAKSECNFCHKIIPGSYTRVRAHLLKIAGQGVGICRKVIVPIFEQLRREVAVADAAISASQPRSVPLLMQTLGAGLPPSGATSTQSKRRKKQIGIEESFHNELHQMADALIVRMFYTSGLPFNLARNPNYLAAFTFLANNDLGGYVPSGHNKLMKTLLQLEKDNVERLLEPIKTTWPTKGVTIAFDGWSDAQRRSLINFIAIAGSGLMFLRAINTSGDVKNKEYIVEKLITVIEEVGAKNVVQVITDNASNCEAAGLIVEQRCNNIFWTPCVVHTLNLALKNICAAKNNDGENDELMWIKDVAGDAFMIKNFIMNHSMRLSMFNEYSKLKFLAIADTRFAPQIVMLKRFLVLRDSLVLMVVGDKWLAYRDDDKEKARFVKEKLLDDVWWDQVRYIVDFTEPIYSMLRAADIDKPSLHSIYEMWDTMIEKVKDCIYHHEGKKHDEESVFYEIVHGILEARWAKSNTPLDCLAHSLNPRYYTPNWLSEAEGHVAPHDDVEISDTRNKCFRKFQNQEIG